MANHKKVLMQREKKKAEPPVETADGEQVSTDLASVIMQFNGLTNDEKILFLKMVSVKMQKMKLYTQAEVQAAMTYAVQQDRLGRKPGDKNRIILPGPSNRS